MGNSKLKDSLKFNIEQSMEKNKFGKNNFIRSTTPVASSRRSRNAMSSQTGFPSMNNSKIGFQGSIATPADQSRTYQLEGTT
jgi:hypothetical protein